LSKDWERYRKMLDEKVMEARHNLEFYEKKVKEAKVILGVAERGQESFEQALLEQLEKLESKQNCTQVNN
jgi:hypothetical protein